MKTGFLVLALLMGCSGGVSSLQDSSPPRCLDLCAMNFAQCTERHPGDYTACADQRRSCDQECRSQEAEAEAQAGQAEVLSPNDMQMQPSTQEPARDKSMERDAGAPD